MKTLLDRPFTNHIRNFDRMVTELSPHMTELEIDACIAYMFTLKDTKWDVNPSPSDCKTQLEIMFGKDRVLEMCKAWGQKNQKFLTVFGTMKYKRKSDNTLWDGLDDTDNPNEYEKVYI